MSEDTVKVKIEADASDFQGALKDALNVLTSAISDMKNSFSDLAESIRSSMAKSADATNGAARTMSDGMKDSAAKTAAATEGAAKTLSSGVESAMNQAAIAAGDAAEQMSGGMQTSMQQAAQGAGQAAREMGASIEQSANQAASSLTRIKTAIGAIGIGIVGVFGGAAKETIAYEKSLLGLSRTSGLTIEATSRLAYAGNQCGLTTEDLGRNIGILSRNIAVLEKDTDSATNVFNRFGIDVHGADNKLLSADEIILKIADRFKSMPDGVEKTALSMQLFGRQGQAMIPILNQGSAGIQKLGKDAEKLGLVFKDVDALKAYTAATKQYNATLKGLQIQIGTAVLPVLTAFSKAITSVLKAFNGLDPAFKTTVITAASIVGSIAALTLGWGAAAAAIAAFGGPFARVGTMMQSMPNLATTAVGGIKGLVAGLADATIGAVKFVASGGLMATASKAIASAGSVATAAMHTMRTAVMAVTLAYNTGGVKGIASYCASLVSMSGIAKVARLALMLLYGAVLAGVAVVVALALAWTTNFGGIHEATAGTCDGITYGLNNFATGIGQIAEGIGQIFVALALTIGKALVGDFSGAIDEARGLLDGVKNIGAGAWGAMQGFGQAIYGAASDPEGALNFGKAAWQSIVKGGKDLMGLGDQGAPGGGDGLDPFDGPMDGGGGAGEAGGSGADGGQAESEYEKAKKLYDQQIQLAEYSATEKQELYKKYLENVQKAEQEAMDYKIGLYALDKDALTESLRIKEIDLENDKLRGKTSEEEYVKQIAGMKKQNLEAELTFRAKAALETTKLTEEEKAAQLEACKEKMRATIWYKEALQGLLEAEKNYAEFQKEQASQTAEFRKQLALSTIEAEENRAQIAYEQEEISQEELLKLQEEQENRRYAMETASLEQTLTAHAINLEKMKALYEAYKAAQTIDERTKIMGEMEDNSTDKNEVRNSLMETERQYVQHTNKLAELKHKLWKNEKKDILEVRDTMQNSISQAFQDILTKGTTVFGALKNIWSSIMKTILKQLSDTYAKTFTDKILGKFIGKDDDKNASEVKEEQDKQNKITNVATQGIMQRYMVNTAANQTEIMATQATVGAEVATHLAGDQATTASAQAAGQASVQSIMASVEAMLQMMLMMLVMSALTRLFSGGSKTTESTGPGINLGRNPDSYYQTPSGVTSVPSFDVGSWRLPADTLAMVHKDEMIVPAKGGLADGMRNMLSSGGTAQSSPNISLNYSAAHYGRTNRDVQLEMRQNAKYMVKMINNEWRNFNRGQA